MNILLIAYKIEAGKGSEDAIGYHFCKNIAQEFSDVTLITRENNAALLKNDPAFKHVTIYGVDVPKPWRAFKRKSRGIILYYYLWQIVVGRFVTKLQQTKDFDIIHQITFATTWAPHFIYTKRAKIVWGPLINHSKVPFDFWFQSKASFLYKELATRMAKRFFWKFDPFLKHAISRTDRIFLANDDMPNLYGNNTISLACAASNFPVLYNKAHGKIFNILYVGRFVDLKGCMASMEALRIFLEKIPLADKQSIEIDFVGSGSLEADLKNYTRKYDLPVRFTPWVDQQKLSDFYTKASLFLYPSFEGQGLVVAEAMAHGCPVLCLAGTGPATLAGDAGITVQKQHYQAVIQEMAQALKALFSEYKNTPELYKRRMTHACDRAQALSWENKAKAVIGAYHG